MTSKKSKVNNITVLVEFLPRFSSVNHFQLFFVRYIIRLYALEHLGRLNCRFSSFSLLNDPFVSKFTFVTLQKRRPIAETCLPSCSAN